MRSTTTKGSGPAARSKPLPVELTSRFANPVFCDQGGMGRVWAAHDRTHNRQVAVKVLREDVGQYADARDRFWAEAARMQQVPPHPNVIEVFDYGVIGDWCYLTMPLLSGPHVGAIDLLAPEVLGIIQQTAVGLAHLHAHGIVHRDIKPSNLVLDGHRVVIVDFGVAKAVNLTPITTTTSGTEGYMPPELRHPQREVTPAWDIYSLGCVLHVLLTGAVPGKPPHPGREIPGSIEPLLARMLAEEPTDRPNATQVSREIASFLAVTQQQPAGPMSVSEFSFPEPPTNVLPESALPVDAAPVDVVPTAVAPVPTAVAPVPVSAEVGGVRGFVQDWGTARGYFGRERLTPAAWVVAGASWLLVCCGGGWVVALIVLFLLRVVGLV